MIAVCVEGILGWKGIPAQVLVVYTAVSVCRCRWVSARRGFAKEVGGRVGTGT
jgi:hypothetical protein